MKISKLKKFHFNKIILILISFLRIIIIKFIKRIMKNNHKIKVKSILNWKIDFQAINLKIHVYNKTIQTICQCNNFKIIKIE